MTSDNKVDLAGYQQLERTVSYVLPMCNNKLLTEPQLC